MIGVWAHGAQAYLLVLASLTTLFFAIPIFFVPLRWSRFMLWRTPEHTDLAVYFGRCLGAYVLIVEFLMFRAGLYGTGLHFTFEILMMAWCLMIAVHVWGALKRIQPVTETVEIGFWGLLIGLTLAFWPAAA